MVTKDQRKEQKMAATRRNILSQLTQRQKRKERRAQAIKRRLRKFPKQNWSLLNKLLQWRDLQDDKPPD